MKISAVICEYNPFHNGHTYQISQTRRQTGCDFVVAIMSGSFVQRGLPAVYDKWTRAKAALLCGADLVLELPTAYACASAERFARGGVMTAEFTGIVDTLSFGCETTDLAALKTLAELFLSEPEEYRDAFKELLSSGISYPAARAEAAARMIPGAKEILNQSNAILGIEYLKALKRLGSEIKPHPILRRGAAETDDEICADYPSALAIRSELLRSGALPARGIPEKAAALFQTQKPVFLEDFSEILLYRLRSMTSGEIAKIAEVSEGLEHKLYAAARSAQNAEELIRTVKSKRYPQSRIQRILTGCLLHITKDLQQQIDAAPYLRVLGVKKESKCLLSLLSQHAKAPVITSPAGQDFPGLALDLYATDIRALADRSRIAGRDYTEKLIVL